MLRLTRFEYEAFLAKRRGEARKDQAKGNRWESELALQLDLSELAGYVRQHRFHPPRKFSFDFAWVDRRFAIEVDGAVHRIKGRYQRDQKKFQLALLDGWQVLHVTPDQVRNGEAIALCKTLIIHITR